jgi:hypothetical protein
VNAHLSDSKNRVAVGGPGGAVDVIRKVGQKQPRRAADGGHDEERAAVVGLEPPVRLRDEQHLRSVRRDLGLRLFDVVVGQLRRPLAVGVHDPDFAAGVVENERRWRAMHRDARAVARQAVRDHGEIAVGDRQLAS